MNDIAKLVGRILLATIFISAGWSKIGGYDGTAGYMSSMGVPGILLPLVILTELGGGLAVLVGAFTRWAALALAGFCVLAALLFHRDFTQGMNAMIFWKDLAIAGGFLFVFASGAGAYSVDAKVLKKS
jgi:putative oxidoreductase